MLSYLKAPCSTFAFEKVYIGAFFSSITGKSFPSDQYSIPLKIVAISLRTLYASVALVKYKFALNLGSVPPLPSGTNSSQYLAILYNEYLSMSASSINPPSP